MDQIFIRDIRVSAILGIHPHERRARQQILINLILDTDIQRPATTDRIEDALDYQRLTAEIVDFVSQSERFLIEALVTDIAALVLQRHPIVHAVRVRVEKPSALDDARSVGIEILRTRAADGDTA